MPKRKKSEDRPGTSSKVIGWKQCSLCRGAGQVPILSWPKECVAECAPKLLSYYSGGQYWLCDQHVGMPVLWSNENKEQATKWIASRAMNEREGFDAQN